MRAETERLLYGALRKIVRGVVAGNRGAVVGKLAVLQLIHLARRATSANAGRSPTERDNRGAVSALDERAGVCGDGPWRPLARFVGGGFPAGVSDVDWRTRSDQVGIIEVAIIEHQDFVRRSCGAERRADKNATLFRVHRNP